jgi:hypothetical protein
MAQPVDRSIIWMDLKVTGTARVGGEGQQEIGVALGKRVAVGNRGVGVDVAPGVGVGVGGLIGGLVSVGASLGEGVSVGEGAGTQATCAAAIRVQSSVWMTFTRRCMGLLLSRVGVDTLRIVAGQAHRRFHAGLPLSYRDGPGTTAIRPPGSS